MANTITSYRDSTTFINTALFEANLLKKQEFSSGSNASPLLNGCVQLSIQLGEQKSLLSPTDEAAGPSLADLENASAAAETGISKMSETTQPEYAPKLHELKNLLAKVKTAQSTLSKQYDELETELQTLARDIVAQGRNLSSREIENRLDQFSSKLKPFSTDAERYSKEMAVLQKELPELHRKIYTRLPAAQRGDILPPPRLE